MHLLLRMSPKDFAYIGSLSPTYQVQATYLLAQINNEEELNQQHRDLLAQERDDIWLQILDLRMRFDIKWPNSLEGYMYVGAVRYLSNGFAQSSDVL